MLDRVARRTKFGSGVGVWSWNQGRDWTLPSGQDEPTVRAMKAVDSQIRPDLIDTMMDLYCEWRTECKEVQAAYERVSRAAASDRAAAFAAYTAALDREESACQAYAEHIRHITAHRTLDSATTVRRREGRCP
jgi:hypothetical protein